MIADIAIHTHFTLADWLLLLLCVFLAVYAAKKAP